MALFLVIVVVTHVLCHLSDASQCSQLRLNPSHTDIDENYSIRTERIQSSNIIQVSLIVKQPVQDETSWFVMGASDSSKLVGTWNPLTTSDGAVIECSSTIEQAVTQRNLNQIEFTFHWLPPVSLEKSVIFVATIFDSQTGEDTSTVRYIQSTPIETDPIENRYRRDVSPTFCNSSPCLNLGTCIPDPQYSYCRCVAPWNGVFCGVQYFHILLGSNLPFTSDFYFNTLNSPAYANLTNDVTTWLNQAFSALPSRTYSINFVAPSPFGTYISVSMALTPTSTVYSPVILSALATALAKNNTTPLGRQLSIDPNYITAPVTQDSTPYTSCVFPFALALVDYNFCIPLAPNFICSSTRVIDRNTTYSSLDCSRYIFNYVPVQTCFPNPCLNGGTCSVGGNGAATCTCPTYFTGSRCDQLFGCNVITNSLAVTCTNGATCVGNTCVCASNNTIGTLCEIVAGNTGCSFPFTYMNVTYASCAVISGQSLCVARNAGTSGQFPVSLVGCGAPQCLYNPCGNRGTCQDTVSGSFNCINCATGYSGYFCELQYRSVQLSFNKTNYVPDYQNLSSNASLQLQALINQTLSLAFANITNGGVRPDLVSFIENPDGTTSAIINVNTNYLNFLNNATQQALNSVGAITTVLINTTRNCAPWYIYNGRNVTGCVTNALNIAICSLTNNFDRDGQYTTCSQFINLNLCNNLICGDGRCIATSQNVTYCQCPTDVTGTNCDQLIRCSDSNCLNNGTCVSLTTGYYRCNCTIGYGGAYCQYNIIGCSFPFVDNQNQTHNTCVTTSDYLSGTVPWCRTITGQPRSCQIDYCAQKPCVYGICIPTTLRALTNSYSGFICNCTSGFTGRLCTHEYFRVKYTYNVPNISNTSLWALQSPSSQAYQNLSLMFRNLVRNRTNSSYDFLPLVYTTFQSETGNAYQVTADLSYPGNISYTDIANIISPILSNLPPEFNAIYAGNNSQSEEQLVPLSPANNCTLPYGYNSLSLAVCHMDNNFAPYCSYGQNYNFLDRQPCDRSGVPTQQNSACAALNITNPCNTTSDFIIDCISADDGWSCFCRSTQTVGKNCGNLDFCRSGALLCQNNATCINRPDLSDFSCNCSGQYYGRYCENFAVGYTLYLLNYSNSTSPGLPVLIAGINQTIINITQGRVVASTISISPAGQVTISVVGTNYSIPQFQVPFFNLPANNWTVGPYLVSFNQTSVISVQTNVSCVFPFAYNGMNYTTCITTGFGFPWCSSTPVFTGRIVDCRTIDWCASGPCLNNGTCTVNQITGTFQCRCANGWTGVQCAYPTTTITIVLPLGNNTFNNLTFANLTGLLPNVTNGTIGIDTIRPGPNNTVVIVVVVNGTNVPNITLPNLINITTTPIQNVNGCVFPFIYNNRSYYSCIPINLNRSTFCCQNSNCDLNPQWQYCNTSNVCGACASYAGCALSGPGVISCVCPLGYTGNLCESPLDICSLLNRSCLNNAVCVINPNTSTAFCNCSSPVYTGVRCETFLPCNTSNPCLNNGTCSPYPNGTVQCNCTSCYSGSNCQIPNYCCLNVCSPNGVCLSAANNSYVCICNPNYVGPNCTNFNPCALLPCQYNGTCVVTNNSYVCVCPTGYTGVNCLTITNPCLPSPCRNNGICLPSGTQAVCICPAGFNGSLCEVPINPCGSNPCQNNGTCYQQAASINATGSTASSYVCICNTTLYTGIRCETIIPPCTITPGSPAPCRNGGTCNSTNGITYSCYCAFPYSGTNCDTIINPCVSNPCSSNGQCYINIATSNFTCVCVNSSLTGPLCQNLTNPCASSPCTNGSTCVLNGTGFICQCPANRTGVYCENNLIPCTNTTCYNNGTCLYSGVSFVCQCPPSFIGPQCLTPVSPCLSLPCLHNGTCYNQSSTSFLCSCPPNWTGTVCGTFVNPCLTYPCFFGGTCVLNGSYQPSCLCPATQTGLYCLTTISPCTSSPCLNNGTCYPSSTGAGYVCTCPVLFTGTRCENLVNACSPSPCIFGTCYSLNNGTFYCACAAGYTGLICDHPISPCSLSPCVNNGSCVITGTTSYICVCPIGYTGLLCEQLLNPCTSSPCRTGTCFASGTRYVCACDASHTGQQCDILINPCLSSPCLNNQTCVRDATNLTYICLCAAPYTGLRCATTVLPCTTLVCLNGGTCIQPTLLTGQCSCPAAYTGTYCDVIISPCQSRPCLNNGTCLSTVNNSFLCICLSGYTGTYCEQFNPCSNSTCSNGGTCVISQTAVNGQACLCPSTYTGQTCTIPISPCASSPCVNSGICLTAPGTLNLTCICTPAYTGVFCQVYINPCTNYQCLNGGTCYRTVNGAAICACLPAYTGAQCATMINPCLSMPCLNNGICLSSTASNYTCVCPINYTGSRCENLIGSCSTTLCQNNGTCVYNGLNMVSCICPPMWTGTLCLQAVNPCATSNPCLNGGSCVAIFNSTAQTTLACQCLVAYTGTYCQTQVSPCRSLACVNGQCLLRADGTAICYCNTQWTGAACDVLISPCVSQPCLNNGICFPSGVNYTCLCLGGYSGSRCEVAPPNLCTLNCTNNGTCAIRALDNTQICVCPSGYTGTRCEIQLSLCNPSPCLNNGICLTTTYTNGTLGFLCICTRNYTGLICSIYQPAICGNTSCLNGGTCLIGVNGTVCSCPPLFTGSHCESLSNPCLSQPCVNGGTCYITTTMGRKKRQIGTSLGYYCQCLSVNSGTRCETFTNLCASSPCQNNGTCYIDSTSNQIRCVCTPNYTGTFCNTTTNATNVCTTNPSVCFNGGTCRATSSSSFACTCPPTATGVYCEQPINACNTNSTPCLNNGTCIPSLTGYVCSCPNGFTGTNCSVPINPCSSQPCYHNGLCIANGTMSYLCICPTNYSGARCEICNCPCNVYPCLNGGICQATAIGGVVCTCPAGYTGVRCEISSLPCDSNPCLNGGVCLYNPITMNMTCLCCGLATGRFCEILLNPCNTSTPYCFNGGTCYLDATLTPRCVCPTTFTGLYCQTYSSPCSSVTCIQGTCVTLSNSSFLCVCPTGRSGQFCEIVNPCLVTTGVVAPCRNGGTCTVLSGTSYLCACPAGFTGVYCDIANPCASMPCAANATCASLLNGNALCICPTGMTGTSCNQTILSSFCSSSPCRNNGTCVGTSCLCPNNTSGATCNVTTTPCPTTSRPTLACANGGTCIPGYGCFCATGFAGIGCETPIIGACTSTTCSNGGTCVQLYNGTLTCTCPSGYTGATCQTYISLCSPNPCQYNGTCVPSGTTGYVCVCPSGFTGPQCNLLTNPCFYLPCFNGGTCVQSIIGGYSCVCLPTYTGSQCQTILNPCLSSPCNTGTCVVTNSGLAYVCVCPSQLTGPTCLVANLCGLQPCVNGGTCVLSGAGTYTCVCPVNFFGTNCQTYNLCASNPCINGGTCTQLTSSTISCICPPTYFGDRCQTINPCANFVCAHGICQLNAYTLAAQCACYAGWSGTYCDVSIACLSNPCVYGTCVASSSSGYVCNCITGYYGAQCQYSISQTACQSNPCRNGGTCQLTTTNGYTCLCPASYVGTNCDFANPCLLSGASSSCQVVLSSTGTYICSCTSNPCSSNPCQYGACTVINSGLGYSCLCYANYLGNQCNLPNPCALTACYNGGTCIATVNSASTQVSLSCQCPASQNFIGTYCEHYNPCVSAPCMNGATCTYYINITCFFYCTCPVGYTGVQCQFSIAQIRCESVNIPNNCRNGGTCVLVGSTPQCFCPSLYTGTLCETTANMCSLRVCQNGGTCTMINSTTAQCRCPSTFQGQYCEYSTNPCSVQPCLNGGQCIGSGVTYSCNCAQTMYTGPRCQTLISAPCAISPCLNGGTCQTIGSSYVCICPTSYTGSTCAQPVNLCLTNPCVNGGTCFNFGTFFLCNCPAAYAGDRCQYNNQCFPNSPCLNGGSCISVLSSFSCQCPVGRTGVFCQYSSDDPCAVGFGCLNGGQCVVLSGTSSPSCLCQGNFTGTHCDQTVSFATTVTVSSTSIVTVVSQPSSLSSSLPIEITTSVYLNTTSAPYACNDTSIVCLAYGSYCARENEFGSYPVRVLCPRTCQTCCEDFYSDGTCSLANCQRNPSLQSFCRKSCICGG